MDDARYARLAQVGYRPPAPGDVDRRGDPRYSTIADYCAKDGRFTPCNFRDWAARAALNGAATWLGRIGNEPAVDVEEFEAWIARCGPSL